MILIWATSQKLRREKRKRKTEILKFSKTKTRKEKKNTLFFQRKLLCG
jgi:hypothetical protein